MQLALAQAEVRARHQEISHVEAYLALETARLDERLQVIWANLARELLETNVPTLVMQPMVENAV